MRILQMIDTLHPGGAERVAVNYANALIDYAEESHICITRENGVLKEELLPNVKVHFLNKKSTLDINALTNLVGIIKRNEISIVQAHSSSWFYAVLCKYLGCDFKLIWHDHYGNSDFLKDRPRLALKLFSNKINGVISVNSMLQEWAKRNLPVKRNIVLNNFIDFQANSESVQNPFKGTSKFNLVCVANLRPQKDHNTLIEAFLLIRDKFDVSLHLLGKSFDEDYDQKLKEKVENIEKVYYYGSSNNINAYLQHADIGLLSSKSEAFPLVLLEYCFYGLPVVCTKVGASEEILGNDGFLIAPGDFISFSNKLEQLLKDEALRKEKGLALSNRINELYSKNKILSEFTNFCNSL